MKWISLKKHPFPNDGKTFFVSNGRYIATGFVGPATGIFHINDSDLMLDEIEMDPEYITHWMPFSAIPLPNEKG